MICSRVYTLYTGQTISNIKNEMVTIVPFSLNVFKYLWKFILCKFQECWLHLLGGSIGEVEKSALDAPLDQLGKEEGNPLG